MCVCQKRIMGPLELELQVVVSCLLWALGTGLRSFTRATGTLNQGTISSAPVVTLDPPASTPELRSHLGGAGVKLRAKHSTTEPL